MKHNFSAGPAILPPEVFNQASEAIQNFNNSGLSILEISHRSKDFVAVTDEAAQLVREIGGFGDEWAVLFLTGGASTQFYMAPMNFLKEGEKAAYLDTGAWSSKAIKEAKKFGDIDVVASSRDKNYGYIPKGFDIPSDTAYLHITSNNTIYGTQVKEMPVTSTPIICDMSSDMFSRPIDTDRYKMIYAGAQKNIGPAGVTLVLVKKEWLERSGRDLPTMLNYKTHVDKGSMFNTPPVFPIYVLMLTLRWLKGQGGLKGIQQHNEDKGKLLYDELDRNSCFTGTAAKEDRSLMNVCFLPTKEEYTQPFLDACQKAGINGIKGHRSVGGFRASIYNAMRKESIQALIGVMQDFEKKQG